jgi:hypothetical protein
MNEHLLQHVWLHRLYDAAPLLTIDGQKIVVLDPGQHNRHQGPDFLHARIKINDIELVGSVEVHLKTSMWDRHHHTGDKHYQNVILHLVWQHDKDFDPSIPVLSLEGRLSKLLLEKYTRLMTHSGSISCASRLQNVSPLVVSQWKERILVERLLQKATQVEQLLNRLNGNTEAVFWCLLFRNMGMPVNADAFESIFFSVSFSVWKKVAERIQVIEALLLGQCGLLEEVSGEHYLVLLKKEYQFLQQKYELTAPALLVSTLRMRPAHFPVVRLAQTAMLLHEKRNLFSIVEREIKLPAIRQIFKVTANDFWHHHYSVSHPTVFREKQLGMNMIHSLIINTVLPFRFMIALRKKDTEQQEWVLQMLRELKAEKNHIMTYWKEAGLEIVSAADSQALLGLYSNYCRHKKCLSCAIGAAILK